MGFLTPLLCRNCGVENFTAAIKPTLLCPICSDDRQYPDPQGQTWLAPSDLGAFNVDARPISEGAYALTVNPKLGIGHTSYLLRSEPGWVLWDPLPVVKKDLAECISEDADSLSGLRIAASHPHMFGAQSQWSTIFDGEVHINELDSSWTNAENFPHRCWSGSLQLGRATTLFHIGGHFPGSSYLLWRTPGDEEWLFVSDTTQIRPNGMVAFQWSYPNMLPLGEREVLEMLARLPEFAAERAFDNFGRDIRGDIRKVIKKSAHHHIERLHA